jgi:UDP-glucose:(heptosyl)LPS alpha-1,3-glucosyltransferase
VRPYYAAGDVFVLATLYDPQPNAALEAMACGLPVVTTPKCGVAELLDDGRSGFVRDALDAAGIAQAIASLDGDMARTMGLAGREAVAAYTPEAMAREYLDLYRRLLRR